MPSLTARIPAGADAAGFVPELWSKNVLDAVHMNLVILPLVDHTWEPELRMGDTMNVGVLNTVTATEVVVGSEGSALDIASGSKVQIVVDQWWQARVVLDEMTILQAQISLISKAQKEAGYAIAKKIDSTLATLFATLNGASILGTDGSAITDDVILEAMETLDEADVPTENRVLIINPSARRDIMTIDKFVRTDYVREAVIPTGKIGTIYGMPVFITNNLANASTGEYAVMLHKSAIAVIAQENLKMRKHDEPLKHQTNVLAEALWGVKIMRNTFGVPIYTRARAA